MPLPVTRLSNGVAHNVPNKTLQNAPFRSFASFLIVLLNPVINKPDYSVDLTIFMISFISLSEIINVVIAGRNLFFWKAACVADATAANPNCIKNF